MKKNKQHVTTVLIKTSNRRQITRHHMNGEKLAKPIQATQADVDWVTVTRNGRYGYSEHSYDNPSYATILRLLYATPAKPTRIDKDLIVYEI